MSRLLHVEFLRDVGTEVNITIVRPMYESLKYVVSSSGKQHAFPRSKLFSAEREKSNRYNLSFTHHCP